MTKSLIAVIALLLSTHAAFPQLMVGPKVGLNLTWIPTDLEDSPDGAKQGLRRGLQVGGFVIFPLRNQWSLQPELLYTQKGQKIRYTEDDPFVFGSSPDIFLNRLNFIELPVLLKYTFSATNEQWQGFFLVGPSIGYWFSGTITEIDYSAEDQEENFTYRRRVTKYYLDLKESVDGGNINRIEVGANIGGGVMYESSIGQLMADIRFNMGITGLLTSGESGASNRLMSLSLAYIFKINE